MTVGLDPSCGRTSGVSRATEESERLRPSSGWRTGKPIGDIPAGAEFYCDFRPGTQETRGLRAATPVFKTHGESEQGKRRGQRQRPQASDSFKGSAEHAPDAKADDNRQGVHRTGARLGDFGMIAANQYLAELHHES